MFWIEIIIYALGMYAGSYAITEIQRMKPSLEGPTAGPLTLFQYSMFLTTTFFSFSLLFTSLGMLAPIEPSFNQLLMAAGLISFAYVGTAFAPIIWTHSKLPIIKGGAM